jgi:hypothetical protein
MGLPRKRSEATVSDVTTCPRCRGSLLDSRVTHSVVTCPHCDLRIDDSIRDLSALVGDRHVKRGFDLLDGVFAGLIGLGVAAVVFLSLQSSGAYEKKLALLIGFALAFAYLDVALILALGRRVLRWWRSWRQGQSEEGAAAILFLILLPGLVFGVAAASFAAFCTILYVKGIH